MRKPELLAPAGGEEALAAAVENGADAVYLGGPMLNARSSAQNFNYSQMESGIKYAHLRGCRVLVTVNTLTADSEIKAALNYLADLEQMGADAIIIQDLGLACLARKYLPQLPLHASTQMTTHNLEGVRYLQKMGLKRIVLAREMSLQQIKHIHQQTGAELEVFIHGALCVGYSGQCLFSSLIGGRSGNRGRCAQPCRMAYQLLDGRGKELKTPGSYLLSTRDLNLSAFLPELIAAGIASFKIEGRMKRPEYVATVVRHYRRLLDLALSNQPFQAEPETERELAQIFNRDFSTGYFFGKPGRDLMSYQRPNNRGVKIGRIKSLGHNAGVEIALEGNLALGDGLEVWVSEGGRLGFEVKQITLDKKAVSEAPAGSTVFLPVPGRVRLGDRIFKTHDARLIAKAQASYAHPTKIPLQFKVQAALDQPLNLQVRDELGNQVEITGQIMGQKALKQPLDQKYLSKQLGRLGNTPYFLADLQADLQGSVIYPASHLNDLRRQALESLEKQRLPLPPARPEIKLAPAQAPQRAKLPTQLAVAVSHPEAVRAAAQNGADLIYLDGNFKGFKPEFWLEAQAIGRRYNLEIIPALPRISSDSDLEVLKKEWQFWKQQGFTPQSLLVGNLGAGQAARTFWPQAKLISDWGFNVFNAYTAEALVGEYARLTLSPELTSSQIQALAHFPVEIIVQGALEMLISEYCLPGSVLGGLTAQNSCSAPCQKQNFALKDRLGAVFPLKTDRFCRMHLYNSHTLALVEETAVLQKWGVAALRLEARTESPIWVAKVTRIYRQALEGKAISKNELEKLNSLTKGHFYRGVLQA